MLRRLLLSSALLCLPAGMAAAASCDINAEQAAVVAAWGSKLRDGTITGADSEAISADIQRVPGLAQQDPEAACALLSDLKVKLGLTPAQ